MSVHGQLSVNGTKVVDEHGNPFQLRGISTHGINWDIGYPYVLDTNSMTRNEVLNGFADSALQIQMNSQKFLKVLFKKILTNQYIVLIIVKVRK